MFDLLLNILISLVIVTLTSVILVEFIVLNQQPTNINIFILVLSFGSLSLANKNRD